MPPTGWSVGVLSARSVLSALAVLSVLSVITVDGALDEPTHDTASFEAAFQGRCGAGSPCEQLCRELHDGTYECGCRGGYLLNEDGYSCQELNSTAHVTEYSGEDVLYEKDATFSAKLDVTVVGEDEKTRQSGSGERYGSEEGEESVKENVQHDVTTLGPSLEQKVPSVTPAPQWTAAVGPDHCSGARCPCPLGRSGDHCEQETRIVSPRFSGTSWVALGALRGAYKRVRLRIRVRPERDSGIILLTGERDDMSGDYLALVLRGGHVELRFDCGSGAGVIRSTERVALGKWNTVYVYRHRWDARLRLNNGRRLRGRSKGLFSRMTFREPVWVGSAGNSTGILGKLGTSRGLVGCIDFLRINSKTYHLVRDAIAGADISECIPSPTHSEIPMRTSTHPSVYSRNYSDHKVFPDHPILRDLEDLKYEDSEVIMRDSSREKKTENTYKNEFDDDDYSKNYLKDEPSKAVTESNEENAKDSHKETEISEDKKVAEEEKEIKKDVKEEVKENSCKCVHGGDCVDDVCVCPLGYAGDVCQITLDLKVPKLNGSSYLRLPGLKDSLNWLDVEITVKASRGTGLLLFESEYPDGRGDFFTMQLKGRRLEFAYGLGPRTSRVVSGKMLALDQWYKLSLQRRGRHSFLGVCRAGDSCDNSGARQVSGARDDGDVSAGQPLLLGGAPNPVANTLVVKDNFSGCIQQLSINGEDISVVSAALGGVNVDNCVEVINNSNPHDTPMHDSPAVAPQLSTTDLHHAIVPKKGFRPKHRKKSIKSRLSKRNHAERSNNVVTVGPDYSNYRHKLDNYKGQNHVDAEGESWNDGIIYPSFTGKDSFIHIDDSETMKRLLSYTLDINIRFRSVSPQGLLVWSGRNNMAAGDDFLSLAVEDSLLVFRYDLGSGEVVIVANHTVDDGLWHRARATRNRQAGVLEVDGLGSVGKVSPGRLKQLNTENGLYIGGLPSIESNTLGKYKRGLEGCISQISLSGDFDIPLSLNKLPHTITNNVGGCSP